MRTPTPEQQKVLNSTARVRVVRASPGSGKTWLVAELIRNELAVWPAITGGIAALSFTRVGGEEIRKAVGYEIGHPHFVGTIDAFLFRFVIRPFLRCCFPWFANPRLIPGEWGADLWGSYGKNQKAVVGQGKEKINIFGCVFVDEANGRPVVAFKPHPAQPLRRVSDTQQWEAIKNGKKQLWERTGQLTHSDAAFWSSKVLEHASLGGIVRAEIVRRFPLVIVDELQDTGYFLAKSIELLLKERAVRGVMVGDPDQAIYEFNGARPDLIDRFESLAGAVTLALPGSLRCASAVARVASHLKDSGGNIREAKDKMGRAFLVRYDEMIADIPRVAGAVKAVRKTASVKVIARQNSVVDKLIGRSARFPPKLGCPPLNHMHRAVVFFRQGRQVAALAATRAALESALFQHEGVTDAELAKHGLEQSEWKRLAVESLLLASAIPTSGSLFNWQTEVGSLLDRIIGNITLDPALAACAYKLKPKKLEGWDKSCAEYLPPVGTSKPINADVPVTTVHGVKGETHDITIFVCPETNEADCPSTVWWSADEKDCEEKRIAYVAMTRSQGDLIVCVSNDCYSRLLATRRQFVASFECMTINECIDAFREQDGIMIKTDKSISPGEGDQGEEA